MKRAIQIKSDLRKRQRSTVTPVTPQFHGGGERGVLNFNLLLSLEPDTALITLVRTN